jgi:ATP-dependent protease ClpP protease subunit
LKIDIKGTIVASEDAWVYDYFGIENVCPKKVNEAIDKANGEKLDVYINSGGGDIFAGSEIYSSLRAYAGEVNIHIVGLAASSASVIAMAGQSDISPTGALMVHNVSCGSNGDYHDMDKASEILKKANKTIAAAYVEKTGMSEKEALEMMDKETWLTSQEAIEKGLIDKIAESKNLKLVASYQSQMLPQSVIEKTKNLVKNPLNIEHKTLENSRDLLLAKTKQKLLNLKGKEK